METCAPSEIDTDSHGLCVASSDRHKARVSVLVDGLTSPSMHLMAEYEALYSELIRDPNSGSSPEGGMRGGRLGERGGLGSGGGLGTTGG